MRLRRLKAAALALLWCAALVVTVLLWRRQVPSRAPLAAEVVGATHQVGWSEPGRLAALAVGPGDAVRAGQPLARLDDADLESALSVARAELEALVADVAAQTAMLQAEIAEQRIETKARLAQAQATLAGARADQAGRRAELQSLSTQLARLEGVLRDGLAEVDRVASMRARERALSEDAALRPETLRAWRRLGDEVSAALAAIEDRPIAVQVRPLSARVEAQQRRIEALLSAQGRRTLRAPVDGHVAAVLHRLGDPIRAGETVIEVVADARPTVRAFAPEMTARLVRPGQRVEVRAHDRATIAQGVVEGVGPAVIEVPRRFWPAADRPGFGRPIFVRLTDNPGLLPGEAADVVLLDGPVEGAIAAPIAGPAIIDVPAALSARTRFEPSGAVWLPERGRFLVVSDDTGHDGGADEHTPMVFLADAAGHLEAEPVMLEGAPKTSDLESITRDAQGRLWLLCSQSRSRKGKRPAKRQWLMRADWKDDHLIVSGVVSLYDTLAARLPAAAQAELGLGDALDVEGMTWFDGSLLLGLKAPADAQGRARIWRLRAPDALMDDASGAAVPQVEIFGAVRLPTGPDGAAGGISEMAVDGDGLLLLSTLADGPAAGAAWRVDLPLGGEARKRADWADLKPEGLARGPDGWVVYFDSDPPRWTRLP